MKSRTCYQCNSEYSITATHKRHRYCSDTCWRLAKNKREKLAMRHRRANMSPCEREREAEEGMARLERWKKDTEYYVSERYKEKRRRYNCRREHRKLQLPSSLTVKQWNKALRHFEYRCVYCGEYSEKLDQEHFIPLSKGGGYTADNIIPSCSECNRDKSDTAPLGWLVMKDHGLVKYHEIQTYLDQGSGQR